MFEIKFRFVAVVIVFGLSAVPVVTSGQNLPTGESSGPLDLQIEVPIWVDELDANSAQARALAQQKLIAAGNEAAEFVPALTDHLSLEAQQRLEAVRQAWRLERTKREAARVIIRFGDAQTVTEALEVISSASDVEFELPDSLTAALRNQTIELPATPMGFWYAVDWVLDRAELDINFYGGDRDTLALQRRREGRPSRVDSAAYAGIYRLEPTVVTARRVLATSDLSGLNITMTIAWQPGRQPIGLTIPIGEIDVVLSNEEVLPPQATADQIDVATSTELNQSEFYLPLMLPTGAPRKISRVSGMIQALLPGDTAAFELDLQTPADSQAKDAMTVTLEAVRKNGPLHELRVGISLENADRSLESHRQWIFENEAYVRLPDGTRLDHLGYETYRQSTSGLGIGYLFDLGGAAVPAGTRLIYESPTSVIQDEVPFLIRDLPLP